MGLNKWEKYYIAHAVLMAVTLVPTVVAFLCTLCMARRRKDPARNGFTYLKVAWVFFLISCVMDIFAYFVAYGYSRGVSDDWRTYYLDDDEHYATVLTLLKAQAHAFSVFNFIDFCTDTMVFLTLVRITTGVVIAYTGEPDQLGKLLRWASYAIATVLGVLAFTFLGFRIDFHRKLYTEDYFYDTGYMTPGMFREFTHSRQIDFSFRVLVFVLALVLVGRSILTKLRTRKEPRVITASTLTTFCCLLWLLRSAYRMSIIVDLFNLNDSRNDADDSMTKPYICILEVVLGVWPQFFLLCVAFALGARKRDGLWSTEQPFMRMDPNQPKTPWGYSYEPYQDSQPLQPLPATQPSPQQQPQQPAPEP